MVEFSLRCKSYDYSRTGIICRISYCLTLILPYGKVIFDGMKVQQVNDISISVKKRRNQLKLTQAECAAFCGVGVRFFSELENGKETLQLDKVLHVLQMLGLNLHVVERENDR